MPPAYQVADPAQPTTGAHASAAISLQQTDSAPLSAGAGMSSRMRIFLVVLTFLTGVALAPLSWQRDEVALVAVAALIPFLIHLRHGGN